MAATRSTSPRSAGAGSRGARAHAGDTSAAHPEDAYTAEPFLPPSAAPAGATAAADGDRAARLAALREAAAGCRGCPLHRDATQTVFSSGDPDARVVLVGEQPGDQEDRRGQPFVGPAGRVLMQALDEAGIDPTETYVTNAVKHFKFGYVAGRGKRRIHKPPSLREMAACRPWLDAELRVTEPDVVVALGATAGKSLLGASFRVTRERGTLLRFPRDRAAPSDGSGGAVRGGAVRGGGERGGGDRGGGGDPGRFLVATIHPSAVLRADDREAAYQGLLSDLRVAARVLG